MCSSDLSGITGIAVHITARVCALAAPGEVLVTRTVRDLVAGSGISFENRGEHEPQGRPGPLGALRGERLRLGLPDAGYVGASLSPE